MVLAGVLVNSVVVIKKKKETLSIHPATVTMATRRIQNSGP